MAAEADPMFLTNVKALHEVIPEDREPEQISVKLGAPWIPDPYVQEFLREAFQDPRLRAHRDREDPNKWFVTLSKLSDALNEEWGTERKSADAIVVHALEQSTPTVNDSIMVGEDIKSIVNHTETAIARDKVNELHTRFAEWLWENDERAATLSTRYNELFNAYVPPDYSQVKLTFPGMSPVMSLYPHQVASVARIISEPSVGLAHATGAGKTRTLITAAIKMRQLGIATKPAIIVPGNVIDGFERECRRLYPNAKILRGSTRTIKGKRREFVARCAQGDFDIVLLTYEAAARMPLSNELLESYTDDRVLGALNLSGKSVKKAKRSKPTPPSRPRPTWRANATKACIST
ncbi:DEAD/DEAH box helicase family protein [Streptosporangium lutulentum]